MKILIVGYFTETSKVNIIRNFPEEWNVVIVPPGEEMLHHIADCQVIIPEHVKIDFNLLSKAKKLKLVQTGAGYDNVDIDACTKLGIWAANAAGVNAQAVAEHVMAFLLSYYKNILYLDTFMKNKIDQNQLDYTGSELNVKTIGIIGYGAIGKRVARFCKAFDMNVLVYTRNVAVQSDEVIQVVNFDDLLSQSDIVTVHSSLNPESQKLMNKEVFKKMKNTALFINTARGGIVNEGDLIEALKNKIFRAHALMCLKKSLFPLTVNSVI